ncbi:MAG: AAA family ATPase [Planctomycetes bacterium]|nr:AAA family ATPase [Planctomycetota bacterium]
MQALLDSTWKNIEPALRGRVGAAVFESWLAVLRPLAMERGVFYLEAPSRLVAERVQQFHSELLEAELSREFGTRVGVSIQARPDASLIADVEVGPSRPIVDPSNRTAWLALRALLEGRELPSTQFLFHGPRGTGKTFLLAWWRSARRQRVAWFDGEGLVRAFQSAFREHRVEGLRAELAGDADLVIDELHRIAGHERIQRELAKVLELRAERDLVTVLASRHHPHELRDCDPSLATWLLAGFVVRLELPSHDARLAYLRALEGPRSQNGRADPIERLAREVRGSYPELKRAWLFERNAQPQLRDHYFQLIDPRSAFERVRDRVAEKFGVPADELVGQSQRRVVSHARKVLSWLCVRSGLSRAEVGRYLGRTRAAISYSIRSLTDELENDAEQRRDLEGML